MNSDRSVPFLYLVPSAENDPFQKLASALAETLDASNRVCFKLEQHQLLLTTGRNAWLGDATSELEEAVSDFREAEVEFLGALPPVATRLFLPPESTLREIAAAAEEPWDYIFDHGGKELRQLLTRVDTLKAALKEMLTRNYLAVTSALAILGVNPPTAYDASGSPAGNQTPSVLFNARV